MRKMFYYTSLFLLSVCTFFATTNAMNWRGGGSDCAPNNITFAQNTDNGFHGFQFGADQGGTNPAWFNVYSTILWGCPDGYTGTANCNPCWKAWLFRDNNYNPVTDNNTVTPNWVDQNVQSLGNVQDPVGYCHAGGQHSFNFTGTGLTNGRYMLYVEYGAGSINRCYVLNWNAYTFIIR